MRLALAVFALIFATGVASAQEKITLVADPDPVIDVVVNGRNARLLVDPRLPDMIVLNPATRERLGVQLVPVLGANFVLEGAAVRGRVARPRIQFPGGEVARVGATVFGAPWAADLSVDGAIGPTALPYQHVHLILRRGEGGIRRSFQLENESSWNAASTLLGEPATVGFDLRNERSALNRAAARFMEERSALAANGEPRVAQFFVGLSAVIQPATTHAEIAGFQIGDVNARTDAPLTADDPDAIIVVGRTNQPPRRHVALGRAALAVCYEIVWHSRSHLLELRCD